MAKKQKEQTNVVGPHWFGWLVLSFIFGFAGGFTMTRYGFTVHNFYTDSIVMLNDYFCLGLGLCCISAFLSILFIRDLICEAHIKALETFYGKSRAIKSEYGEWGDD